MSDKITPEQLRKEAVAVERMHGETLTVDWRTKQANQLRAHAAALEENVRMRDAILGLGSAERQAKELLERAEAKLAALREQLAERDAELAKLARTVGLLGVERSERDAAKNEAEQIIEKQEAEIAALKGHAERMMVEIEDLISLAAIAMRAANNNGGEFDECSELQSARDAVSDYRAAYPKED